VPPTSGSELVAGVGKEAAVEGLTVAALARNPSLPDEEGFHPDRHAVHLLLAGTMPYPAGLQHNDHHGPIRTLLFPNPV
jgi:hypothetical protein